ncbi:unnamed protein product [Triticum turgidum subsp. durum]|uniref:Uncharacterized protein n=1 Tax=Triticum turgidum subsp. durum TaxID=4567 RepID=A0A9R0XRV3_TRITD|nr:unnamed protein product [Triticum turgidum subsp. durum]
MRRSQMCFDIVICSCQGHHYPVRSYALSLTNNKLQHTRQRSMLLDSGVGIQFLVHFTSAYKAEFNATKAVLSVLTKPIMRPLLEVLECTLPLWNVCAETVEYLSSAAMVAMETSCSVVIIWPFWFIFSTIFNIANSVLYPVIWFVGEILAAPFRLVTALASFVAHFFDDIVDVLDKPGQH